MIITVGPPLIINNGDKTWTAHFTFSFIVGRSYYQHLHRITYLRGFNSVLCKTGRGQVCDDVSMFISQSVNTLSFVITYCVINQALYSCFSTLQHCKVPLPLSLANSDRVLYKSWWQGLLLSVVTMWPWLIFRLFCFLYLCTFCTFLWRYLYCRSIFDWQCV